MDYESNEMITVRFPIDNKTFTEFNNRSLDEQETIIKLGTIVFKTGKDRKLTMNNEEWERKSNELRSELRELVETYEKKMKNLKKQINEIKENNKEKMDNCAKEVRDIEKTKWQSMLESLKEENDRLKKEMESVRSDKWTKLNEQRKEYDDKMELLRKDSKNELDKKDDEYRKSIAELTDKLKFDDKNKVASNKGKDGEDSVQHFLTMSLPKADIEDTSQKGGCGDLMIMDASNNVMVEVKNYDSGNVKTSEVTKFKKDIKNNDVAGGIFVSLKKGICNIDDWTIDTIDGKPVVYLCKVSTDMEKMITAFKIIIKIKQLNIDWSVTEKFKTIQEYLKSYTKEKKKQLKIVNTFTKSYTESVESMDKQLQLFIKNLQS